MGFKRLRGVPLPEERQGLIRYTCLCYDTQRGWVKQKIDRLCREVGGEYEEALRAVMCSKDSITAIALRHHVSEGLLYRLRKKFYTSW